MGKGEKGRKNNIEGHINQASTANEAKKITQNYIKGLNLSEKVVIGLPEKDDRFKHWRVPVKSLDDINIGDVIVDAISALVDTGKTTSKEIFECRLLSKSNVTYKKYARTGVPKISKLRNTIGLGDSEDLLKELPNESVDLVFTSPPYFNAKPEYTEYLSYEEYLLKMKRIIHECERVLNEGRFFVMNVSPILIKRPSRSIASRRIAVPFDFHRLFIEEGFEFVDDIIWVKPEGAGWATSRGRRFTIDRTPLQYKPVPVTEYVLVYRKKTNKLIDWLIRKHPDQQAIKESKVKDGYETTNIWKITPSYSKFHPATFPAELAEKVITYYSFKNDVVLDPFGGIGTTALSAHRLGRRFTTFDINPQYIKCIEESFSKENIKNDINWIHWS